MLQNGGQMFRWHLARKNPVKGQGQPGSPSSPQFTERLTQDSCTHLGLPQALQRQPGAPHCLPLAQGTQGTPGAQEHNPIPAPIPWAEGALRHHWSTGTQPSPNPNPFGTESPRHSWSTGTAQSQPQSQPQSLGHRELQGTPGTQEHNPIPVPQAQSSWESQPRASVASWKHWLHSKAVLVPSNERGGVVYFKTLISLFFKGQRAQAGL